MLYDRMNEQKPLFINNCSFVCSLNSSFGSELWWTFRNIQGISVNTSVNKFIRKQSGNFFFGKIRLYALRTIFFRNASKFSWHLDFWCNFQSTSKMTIFRTYFKKCLNILKMPEYFGTVSHPNFENRLDTVIEPCG